MKEKYDAVKESEKFQMATEKAGAAVGTVLQAGTARGRLPSGALLINVWAPFRGLGVPYYVSRDENLTGIL